LNSVNVPRLTGGIVGESTGVGRLGRRCKMRVFLGALHMQVNVAGMAAGVRVGVVVVPASMPVTRR
jgi:hypothetical protein